MCDRTRIIAKGLGHSMVGSCQILRGLNTMIVMLMGKKRTQTHLALSIDTIYDS